MELLRFMNNLIQVSFGRHLAWATKNSNSRLLAVVIISTLVICLKNNRWFVHLNSAFESC